MARLLKSAYFKVSSHPKLRSYATKANPYVEVLKTLRLWERELKNKIQNRSPIRSSNEYVSQSESSLNIHKNFHPNEDIHISGKILKEESSSYCDNTLTNDSVFKSDNCDMLPETKFIMREKELQNESKSFHPKVEEILIFTEEQTFNKFMHTNEANFLKELVIANRPLEITENVKHSKIRTTNKDIYDVEQSQKKKKKAKKSKLKSSSQYNKDDLKDYKNEHLLNNLSLRESKDFFADTLQVKSLSLSEQEVNFNHEHLSDNTLPANIFNKLPKDSSPCESGKLENFQHSEEKPEDGINIIKSQKKTKSNLKSKKALQTSVEREELKKKEAKDKYALKSLKCSVAAYINANEIDQAQRYFEYANKKKENIDVEVYNIIIAGWANLGRLDKVKQLFLKMHSRDIVPNLMSYASYLEAIANSRCIDVTEIANIVDQMKKQGYTPKDLFQNCVFVRDKREKVYQVLGFVEQDLSLPPYVPEDAYSFKLLDKLNDKNYEREEGHFDYCFHQKDIPNLSATQMELESQSSVKIKSVNLVSEITDKIKRSREYLKTCEKEWREALTKQINKLKSPKSSKQFIYQSSVTYDHKGSIHPYLSLIETEAIVNLILQETRMLAETAEFYSPSVKQLYNELGSKVMKLYFISLNKNNAVTDKVHFIYDKYLCYLLDPDLCAKYSPREYWEFLKNKYCEGATIDISNDIWPYSLIVYIGSVLYDVMSRTICFNPNVMKKSDEKYVTSAFRIHYENVDIKLYKQMRTHDVFAKLYREARLEYLDFDVTLVPMLSPPRPWVKYDCGGLLITKVPFIRFPEYAHAAQNSYYSKVSAKQLNPCFDSLNCLSLCPWIINKPILDIVTKIFQEGGSEELDIPLNPANFKIDHKPISAKADESMKASLRKAVLEYEKKKGEMTSLWFDCLYKLSIANHFRDKIFWFPHNLDFRGRVYPTPPHFNHLGSDLSRSILLFASGKPLGKNGLNWLKIHLINLTGFKKRASHAERLAFANEMLPEILDSADNPFGKSRWWMTSDKPLQTLACCKEVASAVRHPIPEEYISHFPVHQDGSCNGLQHYAALGRDELGAIEVNLHPSNSPQDVYSGVAALVEKERSKDAKAGLEVAQVLDGFITRKVVKQTVMTFVYGVTPYGARLQVLKQLKDMSEFPEKNQHEAATYLMKKIFLSIKEMFTATKRIQDWFTQCAEEITRVNGEAVEWMTPVGLPVIQPYYKETIVRSPKFCITKSSDCAHYSSKFEPYEKPNVRKQKNAFAPNFIHSLDSTHMMLTSLFCHRKNVTFVSVHDCYWTHAVTVEAMNQICREQFVSLHSEPILENLSQYFLERFTSINEKNDHLPKKKSKEKAKMQAILSAVPEIGKFDLKLVLNSEYFFS